MSKAKRPAKETRLATLQTWQPKGRIERILKERQIPFMGDPAALVARAKQLLPQWKPVTLTLTLGSSEESASPSLCLCFGQAINGLDTDIYIALEASDLPLMVVYLARYIGKLTGEIICDIPEDDDDGGGEELPIPHISETELANLHTSTVVQ